MSEFKFPTETIDLPSKGLVYSEDSPLSNGKIEMKYMTAKEEDILTNQNYIQKGTVLDELLKSLIVTKINFDDLIIGDKNAILIAARILGYGKDYTFIYEGEEITIDLSPLETTELDEKEFVRGKNEFSFILPHSGTNITYKLLTHGDERKITDEVKGLQRLNKNSSPELSTRLKYMILSVDGDQSKSTIRNFVDNYFLARDSRAFREHIRRTQPDVKLIFDHDGPNGFKSDLNIPIGVNFFWPDA